MKPKLSIIILNWNSQKDLKVALKSIFDGTNIQDKEIIIVDNGSKDGSVDYIKINHPDFTLIENDINRGVGPARNQGMAIAKGQYIVNLDVDIIVRPHALDTLVAMMDKNPKVGLMGPKLISTDGNLQYTCRKFPTAFSKFIFRNLPENIGAKFLAKEEYRNWDHASPKYVGYVIGAAQMIRKTAMDKIGLYDDRIFYGPEDVDYCLRMWQNNFAVMYNPSAVIVHKEARIARGRLKKIFKPIFRIHLYGLMIYFWKHKYFFTRPKPEERFDNQYISEEK